MSMVTVAFSTGLRSGDRLDSSPAAVCDMGGNQSISGAFPPIFGGRPSVDMIWDF